MRTIEEILKISDMINSPDKELQELGITLFLSDQSEPAMTVLEQIPLSYKLSVARGQLAKEVYELGLEAGKKYASDQQQVKSNAGVE